MHLAGLAGEPRHYDARSDRQHLFHRSFCLERGITYSAGFFGAAQLIFLINVFWSARRGRVAEQNPWQATTLEWANGADYGRIESGPYEYELQAGARALPSAVGDGIQRGVISGSHRESGHASHLHAQSG